MTKLTPTFADQHRANGNGALHVMSAHEPTAEGEQPPLAMSGQVTVQPAPVAAPAPLKIALIGTAPSSRMLAPYNDPSWKIWACSPGNMNSLPRVDVWFELHSNLLWPEYESYGRPYIEWLKTVPFPVYMQDQTLVPKATIFPKDEMVEEFGDSFFTSSFAWMMALAIKEGATEIALYGIDMASRDEYILQRPGFFFFRHEARKRGIIVSAPNESDIMQSPPLYAYVDSTPFGRKIAARKQEVQGRITGMTQQRDQLNNSITYLGGAVEDLDYFSSIWSGVANDMGRIEYENTKLKREVEQLKAAITAVHDNKLMQSVPTFQPMSFPMVWAGTSGTSSPQEIAQFVEEVKDTPQPKKSRKK